jgi:hypothetical protein
MAEFLGSQHDFYHTRGIEMYQRLCSIHEPTTHAGAITAILDQLTTFSVGPIKMPVTNDGEPQFDGHGQGQRRPLRFHGREKEYASSLLRLQAAQLERQAIELEDENNCRRKIRKDNFASPLECGDENVVEFVYFDDEYLSEIPLLAILPCTVTH